MNLPGVVLTDVTVRVGGETVIERVSFKAEAGQTTVLLGSTDSGAATTIKAIAGLVRVAEGRIEVGGLDVTRARPGRRNVAVVFEGHTLFPHMTVFENVAYPLRVARLESMEVERRVHEIAARLGFTAVLDQKPRGVPEGLRRRAGLARAIVREPGAYLFDRTLASLDDDFRGAAREAIGFLREQGRATILLPCADGAEAKQLADRLVVMENGVVLQEGVAEIVRRQPATIEVAGLALAPGFHQIDGVVLAVRAGGLDLKLPEGSVLGLAVKADGVEVGERVTIGAERSALKDRGWDAIEPAALLAFDSTGRALPRFAAGSG